MEITHDFSPNGDADPAKGRHDQLEGQLAVFQKALGHDLPNQILALHGLVQRLEAELGPDAPSETRSIVARLEALAGQAGERMRVLAALGRLIRQPGPVEPLAVDDVMREAAAMAKVLCKAPAVEYHFGNDMPVVSTSRSPLHQLLVQLLRNAVQACSGRTPVVEVGARRLETGGFELSVRDNGHGMGQAQLNQAHAVLAGQPEAGAGLGLVLVRQVVAGWRGAICIRSEPGEGTLVTVLARTF